jgi:hypothetical protein
LSSSIRISTADANLAGARWFAFDGLCFQPTRFAIEIDRPAEPDGPVAELVGIEGGVVSGIQPRNIPHGASDRRPRHEEQYHEV